VADSLTTTLPITCDRRAGRTVTQVRGFLAERVIVSVALDPFLDLAALSQYSSLSRRTLLSVMARTDTPLPHYRLTGTGKVLVRRSEFDEWMRQYRHVQSRLDELIETRRRERAARRLARLTSTNWG
jgi:hypothetical protein